MLKETFFDLIAHYTNDAALTNELWLEIEQHYSHKKRHYHTLQHLTGLLEQLNEVNDSIRNRDTILFTLYYHDVIYNSLKSDNEEKSALLAAQRMKEIGVPADIIEHCKNQILATKSHKISADNDTNYFTDADLSILGQDWETYAAYYKNVRKEYSIYPDLIYVPGRKKVLQHFLSMEKIFKTDFFYHRFETAARKNLQKEMDLL